MNSKIAGVAELTFLRVKEPAFSLLYIFGMVLGYCVSGMDVFNFQEELFMAQIPIAGTEQPLLTGFLIVTVLSVLIGIFTGASDIPKDIDSKMIMLILGKPVSRLEYLIGKYLGIIAICASFFLVSSLSMIISHIVEKGNIYPLALLFRQLSLIYAIFPFVAITVMISCFTSEVTAMILSVIYIFSCFMFCAVPILMEMLPESLAFKSPIMAIYYFFPNFYYFMIPMKLTGVVQIFMILYSASVTVIFLTFASIRFNSRDLI